jgi:hypothetical protein
MENAAIRKQQTLLRNVVHRFIGAIYFRKLATVSQYPDKKSTTFSSPIFMKHTNAQLHCVHVCCTEFHPYRKMSMASTYKNELTPPSKSIIFTAAIFMNVSFLMALFKERFYRISPHLDKNNGRYGLDFPAGLSVKCNCHRGGFLRNSRLLDNFL